MLVIIISFLILICDGSSLKKAEPQYKISTVSSRETPGRPALFNHAESPVWDPENQMLLFVDVHEQNVHKLDYHSGIIHTKHIGYGQVNIVSLVENSRRLLVAVRSALYLLDWDVSGDEAIRLLTTCDGSGLPSNVLNDGKPDSRGRFWAGSKGPQSGDDVEPDKATLYRVEQCDLKPRVMIRPVSISNGLVWALNDSVFYYVDSPQQTIQAFDHNSEKGELSSSRVIFDVRAHGYDAAIPDGMTIDSSGHLWVALMFGGTVLHINPDTRSLIMAYPLPVSRVTSVAWGGPDLDVLYITTGTGTGQGSGGSDDELLAGALFTLRGSGYSGVLPNYFKFDNADSY